MPSVTETRSALPQLAGDAGLTAAVGSRTMEYFETVASSASQPIPAASSLKGCMDVQQVPAALFASSIAAASSGSNMVNN
jgi:hypothetical protein